MGEPGDVAAALSEWRSVLGAEGVDTTPETQDRYARSSSGMSTRPCAVLYPKSTEQVQDVMRVASGQGTPVYPISRGKNWGYGDACAPQDGAAIIDLGRMDRIVEVNRELAYTVIEPGVSQGQLFEALRGTGLWMDCTGAGLDASLVGNTLDRGFGHTRYGDHFLTACGMEVVLADGRVLETGFGHFEGAHASRVYRYGVGPFLDGLFCQSNYGIVTKIGLWLMPEPEEFCFFYVTVDRHEDVAGLVDGLRPLRMAGILPTTLHIGNDLRVISAKEPYPWDEAEKGCVPDAVRARLRKQAGCGAWSVVGSLTGTAAHVRASKKALRKALRKALGSLGNLQFVDDRKLVWAEWAARALGMVGLGKGLREMLVSLRPVYATLKGEPTDHALGAMGWRVREPKEWGDPLDRDAGLLWISPVLPMTGRDTLAVLGLVEPVFAGHGFDLLATFTLINERAMVGVLNMAFDRSNAEEVARAQLCYGACVDALMGEGYVPYRTGPGGMAKLRGEGDTFWDVAAAIKKGLDPGGVIAPGRYVGE